jgi:sigma-B regulation protein RsbU (phosphoserine phosphatase)
MTATMQISYKGLRLMNAPYADAPRILIADDQSDVLEALRLLLRNEGYVVELASSPAGVLNALSRRSFDTLLIDLNYARDTTSGREGIDLLSRIQALDSTLSTVVMTGWGSVDIAVDAMRHGARDFIQKPWDNDRLLATLRKEVALSRVLRKRQQVESERRREMSMAAEAQRRLFPECVPQRQGLELYGMCQPARDVGGDYYDFIELDQHRTAIAIADVEGKGMSAALLMSVVQASLRSHTRAQGTSLTELINSTSELLRNSTGAQNYATIFYAQFDETTRALTYLNAGHNPPLLFRGKSIERLTMGGRVIGLFEDSIYDEGVVELQTGDLLLAFTDGITEAFNPDGEEFGEERLEDFVLAHTHLPATELGEKIIETVRLWRGIAPQHDDLTLVIMRVK